MSFIEMTGATLERIVADDELHHGDLAAAGVNGQTIVRVNGRATSRSAAPAAGTSSAACWANSTSASAAKRASIGRSYCRISLRFHPVVTEISAR